MSDSDIEQQVEKLMSSQYRLCEFIWFGRYTQWNEESRSYLRNKFGISDEVIDRVATDIRKTPSWVISLARGPEDHKVFHLGFKEFWDKKEGFSHTCGNCIHFNREQEYCENGSGHFTDADYWRMCCKPISNGR